MEIIMRKVEELIPYKNNAKAHTDHQIDEIIKSIQEFGMNDPIAIWHDNTIIEGHGRLMACKKMGIKEVPTISLDHLTDEQRKAYGLVHNKLTMNTGWDLEMLAEELSSIATIDMTCFEFNLSFEPETEMEVPEEKANFTYQIIVDCDSEADMNNKYEAIKNIGIDSKTKIV